MSLPPVNYLAVLVFGVVIFMLGGLWYSPLLFAKKWVAHRRAADRASISRRTILVQSIRPRSHDLDARSIEKGRIERR